MPLQKQISHEDIADRLERGEARFSCIEGKLNDISEGIKHLSETVEPLRDDVSTIKEMASGWKALNTIGHFFSWIGKLGAGVALIYAAAAVALKAALWEHLR